LSELPSPAKAYQDAYEKIKMRTRAARWAEKSASTTVLSEGLVPQAYAPTTAPTQTRLPQMQEPPPAPIDPLPQARNARAQQSRPAAVGAKEERALPKSRGPAGRTAAARDSDEEDQVVIDDGAAGDAEVQPVAAEEEALAPELPDDSAGADESADSLPPD